MNEVRLRYVAAMFARGRRAQLTALAASVRDVPALVAELVILGRQYADLVAACRAGLVARRDGEPHEACWLFVIDQLPPAPPGHPLHDLHDPTKTAASAQGARGGRDG